MFLTTSLRYLRILASLGVTWCDPPYFLAYPHVFLTCGPFIGFLGFFHVGQSYSCVGIDRHDGYSADSSAGLAQCGFVGGFIPNFAIFALVSDHLRNFCFYSWDSLLVLTSLLRLPILFSLSLLWWLALGVTAAAHLLWWPLLCCLRGISFCCSSAVSSSSYFCYGCCQLLLSLLGVSVQLVLVHLRFFHSVSCGWLPFWGSPAGCSFTRGRPYGKRSSSSSRSGGRQRFRGVGGGGGRAPPSSALLLFPMFPSQCLLPAPPPSMGLLWRRSPWASLPGVLWSLSTHFSRLLQPSVRSVEDLGVMASGQRPLPSHSLSGNVSLPDGDYSVCAPVGTSGELDGLHRSIGSVSSSAGSSSFSSLSSLHVPGHCLSFHCAVLWPLHGSAGLHQGLGSCFCFAPFYGGSV